MIINALPGKIRTGKFKSLFDLALAKYINIRVSAVGHLNETNIHSAIESPSELFE